MKYRFLGYVGLVFALALTWSMWAEASPKVQKAFATRYPSTASTKLAKCTTCHTKAPKLNVYGTALKAAHFKFEAVESMDSDKDGATNLAEIKALTLPADAKDKPAAAASDSSKSDAPPDTVGAPGDTTSKK